MFRLMKTRQIANICSTPKMLLSSGIAAGTALTSSNSNLSDSQNMKDGQNQASQVTDVQQAQTVILKVNTEVIYTATSKQEIDQIKLMIDHTNLFTQCIHKEMFGKELTADAHQCSTESCKNLLKKFVDITYSDPLEAAQQYDKARFITHASLFHPNQILQLLTALSINLKNLPFMIPDNLILNLENATEITPLESSTSENSQQAELTVRFKSQYKARLPWVPSRAQDIDKNIKIPSAGESLMLARVHLELGKTGISQSAKIDAEVTLEGGARVS